MSLRVQFHFKKTEVIIPLEQLYKKDLEEVPTQKDFEVSLEHAMRHRDGWLAYRNAFGQASYINLHAVERINLIGD